jgi:hypothetical protein
MSEYMFHLSIYSRNNSIYSPKIKIKIWQIPCVIHLTNLSASWESECTWDLHNNKQSCNYNPCMVLGTDWYLLIISLMDKLTDTWMEVYKKAKGVSKSIYWRISKNTKEGIHINCFIPKQPKYASFHQCVKVLTVILHSTLSHPATQNPKAKRKKEYSKERETKHCHSLLLQ